VRQAGEPGLAGITIFLEANCNDRLDGGEVRVTTDANGNYVFADLAAGSYSVREVVPAGWKQTTANPGAVGVTAGNVAGGDFGNFRLIKSYVSKISYSVSHNGRTRTYANLAGHVKSGDVVNMRFAVKAGHSAWVSLASYHAPVGEEQVMISGREKLFDAGKHALKMVVPKTSFEVYSASGKIIPSLAWASDRIGYAAQKRLFSVARIA
jgi:hypothetical protein